MRSILVCLVLSAVAISADLQWDIKEIVNKFPKDEVKSEDSPSNGPRLREYNNFKQSTPEVDYNEALQEFFNVPEVKNLFQYFEKRGIHAQELLVELLSSQVQQQLFVSEASSGEILANIFGYLSKPEVYKVIQKKIETNPEFANLVAAVKDPEFKSLCYQAINSRASLSCASCYSMEVRGFWKKVWNKVKKTKFGVSVSIPLGK